MSSTINPLSPLSLSSPNASSSTSPTTTDPTSSLGSENTFLQLLVAQIKNQDPTQPVDSSTFLTQLAEFSSLEQLIGINQGVAALDPTAPVSGSTTPTTTPPTTSGTQN